MKFNDELRREGKMVGLGRECGVEDNSMLVLNYGDGAETKTKTGTGLGLVMGM